MRRQAFLVLAVVAGLAVVACTDRGAATTPVSNITPAGQPYAELENRPIKALAPERVADLLDGRGAGYALAAELNHYPGPIHVLELSADLQLQSDQERAVRQTYGEMRQQALELGKQLVDLETELDHGFRSGVMNAPELDRLTRAIATVEGQLRQSHLAAHLRMREILTPTQISRYDQLRGYGAAGDPAPSNHGEPEHTPRGGGHRKQH
jgi:hypothetical protein